MRENFPLSISHPVGWLLCMPQFLKRARGCVWGRLQDDEGGDGRQAGNHLTAKAEDVEPLAPPTGPLLRLFWWYVPPGRTQWLSALQEMPRRLNSELANVKLATGTQACPPTTNRHRRQGAGPGSCLLSFLFLLHEGTQVTSSASLDTSPEGHFGKMQIKDSCGGFSQPSAIGGMAVTRGWGH